MIATPSVTLDPVAAVAVDLPSRTTRDGVSMAAGGGAETCSLGGEEDDGMLTSIPRDWSSLLQRSNGTWSSSAKRREMERNCVSGDFFVSPASLANSMTRI